MREKKDRCVSEWKPFSQLKKISEDISELGYSREYIEEHRLEDKKEFHCGSMDGAVCFFEPLEVKKDGDEIIWRTNENHIHMDIPERFYTQFGVFNNHNNGEFTSWLGKDDYNGLPADEREINAAFGREDYFTEGNFCDMFDCGSYSYAVSNLRHLVSGKLKIIRIDKQLDIKVLYDNSHELLVILEYLGRFQKDDKQMIIASGIREEKNPNTGKRDFLDITMMFCIDEAGNCNILHEWDVSIPEANSIAATEDHVYFGQNKMITQLNLTSGEVEYYTDKSDEELAAMVKIF